MKLLRLSLFFIHLLISSSAYSATPPGTEQISFDHLEESTVFLRAPQGTTSLKPIKTNLYDLTYIGTIYSREGGLPYFLLSGKPCQNCLDDKIIYAIRPNNPKPTAFVYPGKILDPKNRSLLIESRAFFGKCLANRGDVFVVFQKERVDRKHNLQSSVYIAEAGRDHLEETLLERRLPTLHTTLQMVKRKNCKEIEGRNRLMLSKPLDLHPHSDLNDDDDDDDSKTEKNKVEDK